MYHVRGSESGRFDSVRKKTDENGEEKHKKTDEPVVKNKKRGLVVVEQWTRIHTSDIYME